MTSSIATLCARGLVLVAIALAAVQNAATGEELVNAEQIEVRFGITADAHVLGDRTPGNEAHLRSFVAAMDEWRPDFVIDLGDFACQCGSGQTTPELHDAQLQSLKRQWAAFASVACPAYAVMGNHDVGWIRGAGESIAPQDLYARSHAGEDITKSEWLAVTHMPARYYSLDLKGYHFLVLDGNNRRARTAVAPGRDGVRGGYWIDDSQKAWVASDLAANRGKPKVVFCHEELHHTPVEGSGEGGDAPFPPVGKQTSYVDNGWELRELFQADGRVLACFSGHKHESRWTVYGGTHYLTLAATHRGGSYAKVTLAGSLTIEGVGSQRSYKIPLAGRPKAK